MSGLLRDAYDAPGFASAKRVHLPSRRCQLISRWTSNAPGDEREPWAVPASRTPAPVRPVLASGKLSPSNVSSLAGRMGRHGVYETILRCVYLTSMRYT